MWQDVNSWHISEVSGYFGLLFLLKSAIKINILTIPGTTCDRRDLLELKVLLFS